LLYIEVNSDLYYEKNKISENDLTPELKNMMASFKAVFPKMTNVVEVVAPKAKKVKKKSADDDDE